MFPPILIPEIQGVLLFFLYLLSIYLATCGPKGHGSDDHFSAFKVNSHPVNLVPVMEVEVHRQYLVSVFLRVCPEA